MYISIYETLLNADHSITNESTHTASDSFKCKSLYESLLEAEIFNEYHTGNSNIAEFRIPYDYSMGLTSKIPTREEIENDQIKCFKLYACRQPVGNTNSIVFVRFPNDPDGLYGIDIFKLGGVNWNPNYKKAAYRITTPKERRVVIGFCLYYELHLTTFAYSHVVYYDKLAYGKTFGDQMDIQNWLVDQARTYNYKKVPERYFRGERGTNKDYTSPITLKATEELRKNPKNAKFVSVDVDDPKIIIDPVDFAKDIQKFYHPAQSWPN